jgi:DNA-binding SARP family transcriptional activator
VSWRLQLVGVFEVRAAPGERAVPGAGSRKARTLLALLGAHGRHPVPVDRIVDELWVGVRPKQPEANVATLVSRVRARFGAELVVGGRAGYQLGDAVVVDLHEAAATVARAERFLDGGHPAFGLRVAEWVTTLLEAGPVLADHPATWWAEEARALQDSLLRRAWHAGSASALQAGRPRRAQVLAEAAIAADPFDERAYRLLMRACVAAGEPARAILAYQRLRTTLAAELGAGPAPESRDLHVTILRGNAAAG